MQRFLIPLALALCFVGFTIAPAAAQQGEKPLSREQIEQIVHDYLLRNPEVLLEAIDKLEEKRRGAAETAQREAVAENRDAIFNDADAPVAGNPQGDVTLVEFFDYRCPYCKQMAPALTQLLKDDKKLRFVFKELPILGPDSVTATRAALAARAQDKYLALHEALIRARGTLDEATVLKIAADAGLDVARLKTDMKKPEIDAIIDANRKLARDLGITGTPAFIIGDRIVPGAVDAETLKKLVVEARR